MGWFCLVVELSRGGSLQGEVLLPTRLPHLEKNLHTGSLLEAVNQLIPWQNLNVCRILSVMFKNVKFFWSKTMAIFMITYRLVTKQPISCGCLGGKTDNDAYQWVRMDGTGWGAWCIVDLCDPFCIGWFCVWKTHVLYYIYIALVYLVCISR